MRVGLDRLGVVAGTPDWRQALERAERERAAERAAVTAAAREAESARVQKATGLQLAELVVSRFEAAWRAAGMPGAREIGVVAPTPFRPPGQRRRVRRRSVRGVVIEGFGTRKEMARQEIFKVAIRLWLLETVPAFHLDGP